VEIYRDAAGVPFEFMDIGNSCGSVAFWTHPIRNPIPVTFKRVGIAAAVIGAIIVAEKLIVGGQQSDISDKPMRGSAEWQDAVRWRSAVRLQVPLANLF
jgi:hypothetical protein